MLPVSWKNLLIQRSLITALYVPPSVFVQNRDRPVTVQQMAGRSQKSTAPERKQRPSLIVNAARAVKNPLASVTVSFAAPSHGPLQVTTSRGVQLCKSDVEWMYTSVKNDLGALYAASTMKWNSAEKREELTHPHQQFVILNDPQGRLAFLSYRYDVEEWLPVMYVYEVFVEGRGRRKGIAVQLMRLAEQMARKTKMSKVLLTTFVANQPAMRLYREKLGYERDESSPSNFVGEGDPPPTYEILSLCLTREKR